MDDPTFDQLADQVTDGLKADPELRLDIRAEVLAHLEDAADGAGADGAAPEESAAVAIQAFGTPVEIAAKLLDANARRMAWRARLRLFISVVFVPLAVVVALLLAYGRVARLANTASLFGDEPLKIPELPLMTSTYSRMMREQERELRQLSAYGVNDQTNWQDPSRYRWALWQVHRHESHAEMYYAWYASELSNGNCTEREFVEAMRFGEKLEPSNALYNYQLALWYLRKGVDARSDHVESEAKGRADSIIDRTQMEMGLREYRKGIRKAYSTDYAKQILESGLERLPLPQLTDDQFFVLVWGNYWQNEWMHNHGSVGSKVMACARVLAKEGRSKEAIELIEGWRPFARQLIDDTSDAPPLLSAIGYTARQGNDGAELYDSMGMYACAMKMRRDVDIITAPKKRFESRIGANPFTESAEVKSRQAYLRQNGACLLQYYYPFLCSSLVESVPTPTQLTPTRHVEYTLLEELMLNGLLAGMAAMLLVLLAFNRGWDGAARRDDLVPILLLPPWRMMARVFGWGIALPLAVYALLAYSPFGLRAYSLLVAWPAAAVMSVITVAAIAYLPARLSAGIVDRRCAELGVPVPDRRTRRRVDWQAASLIIGTLLLLVGVGVVWRVWQFDHAWVVVLLLAVAILALAIRLFRGMVAAHRAAARYYGTLNRTLLVIYAGAIILLSVTLQPLLLHLETRALRADTLIFPKADTGYTVMPMEAALVERWKAEILPALNW